MKYNFIILGGGITGLFVGYKLSERGKKVLIIEKSKDLGGLLGSIQTKGDPIEKYYHHVFVNDKNFLELIKELKINDKFNWFESSLGFYNKGKIYDLSTPFHFVWFKPLNIIEKLRFGLFTLKIKLMKNLDRLDDKIAEDWIIENVGRDVYEKFFHPLLKSKYGGNSDKVSVAWFIERIKLRTTGGISREKLGYMNGGFNLLVKILEKKILENDGKILREKNISKLIIKNNLIQGVIFDGKRIKSDYVISTIPLPELAKFKELPEDFRKKVSKIKYQGAICLILGLDRQLTDFYWTNIIDESSIGALIEHTNFQPLEKYNDNIIYLASYPDFESEVWSISEKKVFEKYFDELKKLFPDLKRKNVKWWKLSRDKNAGLVYETGYRKKRIRNKTPINNLIIGGMFNGYPERSIESSISAGKDILKLVEG